MSKEDGMLGLQFGALAEDVQKQVEDQGFSIAKQDAKQADELMRAVVFLRINEILTRSQATAVETKILKRIALYVRKDLKRKKLDTLKENVHNIRKDLEKKKRKTEKGKMSDGK